MSFISGSQAFNDNAESLEQNRIKANEELNALQSETDQIADVLKRLEHNITIFKKDQGMLRVQLDEAEARQNGLDETIIASENKLADLNKNKVNIKNSLKARNDILAEILAALQRLGSNPPPALLISPNDALSSVRSAILLGAVVPEIRSETEKLLSDLQELSNIEKDITSRQARLVKDLQKSFEEEKLLTTLLKEKTALNVASLQQLEKERNRTQELEYKSNELKAIIVSLNSEIASVKKATEQMRQAQTRRRKRADEQLRRAQQLAKTNVKPDHGLLFPAYPFTTLKHTLEFPVKGSLVKGFGEKDATGQTLAGILLASDNEMDVRAPVDGWVVYSGPFRTYGNIVILNVGEGYHMVLAGMDELKVFKGQFVLSGEIIAKLAQEKPANHDNDALTLALDKTNLYIELRRGKKTIDSTPWWINISSGVSGKASNDT